MMHIAVEILLGIPGAIVMTLSLLLVVILLKGVLPFYAAKVKWYWGIVCFLLPGGSILFSILHFDVAKKCFVPARFFFFLFVGLFVVRSLIGTFAFEAGVPPCGSKVTSQEESDRIFREMERYPDLYNEYADLIVNTLKSNWSSESFSPDDKATLYFEMRPSGSFVCAHVGDIQGKEGLEKSILQAVAKSDPLPQVPEEVKSVFHRFSIQFSGEVKE